METVGNDPLIIFIYRTKFLDGFRIIYANFSMHFFSDQNSKQMITCPNLTQFCSNKILSCRVCQGKYFETKSTQTGQPELKLWNLQVFPNYQFCSTSVIIAKKKQV